MTVAEKTTRTHKRAIFDVAALSLGALAGIALVTLSPLRARSAAIEPVPPVEASVEQVAHNACRGQEATGELELVPDMLHGDETGENAWITTLSYT